MPVKKKGKKNADDLYRMVFEEARDSMLVLELPQQGTPRILDANPAALALHGFGRRKLAGKPVSVLGASLSRGRFRPGSSDVFEVKHDRPGGRPLVTEVTARNVRSRSGHFGILIERDVTWRRRLEEEARELSSRLLQEREEEKKGLAAGIHDSVGAMQVGLSAELLLLEDCVRRGDEKMALAGLRRARKLLKASTAGLKKACVEAWPASLAVSGLGAALSGLLASFTKRSRIAAEVSLSLPDADVPESPATIVLYRLAQEALANAERHSGAGLVKFSAGTEGGWLTLEIQDDGRGFDTVKAAANGNSLGLKIMEDATNSAGGHLSVYSAPGRGTRVRAQLPMNCGRGTAR